MRGVRAISEDRGGNIAALREDRLHFGIKAKAASAERLQPQEEGLLSPAEAAAQPSPLDGNGCGRHHPDALGEASGRLESHRPGWRACGSLSFPTLPASTVVGTAPLRHPPAPWAEASLGREDPKPTLHLYGALSGSVFQSSVLLKKAF